MTPGTMNLRDKVILSLHACQTSEDPFFYCRFKDMLTDECVAQLLKLPVVGSQVETGFDGKREYNNSKRIFLSKLNQKEFPVVSDIIEVFDSKWVRTAISDIHGTDIMKNSLRIEYCIDTTGFWLQPHLDIKEKLVTMQIYLSDKDEVSIEHWGTDLYIGPETYRYTIPFRSNSGYLFFPGKDTWHGLEKGKISNNCVRRSLIINYVSDAWLGVNELC